MRLLPGRKKKATPAPKVTKANAKRYVGVARYLVPLAMPYAVRGAAVVRDRYEQARARRLGVEVEELPALRGKGAPLQVRISALTEPVAQLRGRGAASAEFADCTDRRLTDLCAAVRAADRMPPQRRRSAHRSVSNELATIEADVLTRLGVSVR